MKRFLALALALFAIATALPLALQTLHAQPSRESQESVSSAAGAAALVEHDTNLISPVCRKVYANTPGTMVVDMAREGTDITFTVVAGTTLDIRIKRFKTASTATGVCLF